jgi:hypothetical protein
MQYNTEKARSALVWIVAHLQRPVPSAIWAILYMAERRCLSMTGRLILGDSFVAMKSGPVPLKTYFDLWNHCPELRKSTFSSEFEVFLRNGRFRFRLEDAASRLGLIERDCLSHAIAMYRNMRPEELAQAVCGPAWQRSGVMDEISPVEIALEGGADPAILDFILGWWDNLN